MDLFFVWGVFSGWGVPVPDESKPGFKCLLNLSVIFGWKQSEGCPTWEAEKDSSVWHHILSFIPAVTFPLSAAFWCLSVSTYNRTLLTTVCSVPPCRALQYFEPGPVLLCTGAACCWVTSSLSQLKQVLVFMQFIQVYSKLCMYFVLSCSNTTLNPRKPLWDEAPLMNLQRRESFWLIGPISLRISWKGLGDWGAVLFLWQAGRSSETRALRQRVNLPFCCQFIRLRLTKKKETACVNEFETQNLKESG